jgi:hypothetical protein
MANKKYQVIGDGIVLATLSAEELPAFMASHDNTDLTVKTVTIPDAPQNDIQRLAQEGASPEDLKKMMSGQKEGENVISPSEIQGANNDPSPQGRIAELERRFNNLVAAHYNSSF